MTVLVEERSFEDGKNGCFVPAELQKEQRRIESGKLIPKGRSECKKNKPKGALRARRMCYTVPSMFPRMLHTSAERRLISLFKEVGSNLENWGRSTLDKYVTQPVEQGNAVKTVLGAGAAGLSAFTEAPDAFIAGALDNKVDFNRPGLRTTRDLGVAAVAVWVGWKIFKNLTGNQ